MQKRLSVLLALALMILFIVPVRAQDPLTKTVVAGTSDFPYSFKYPADWGEPQKSFANTQFDNADGSIHVSISSPFVSAGSTAQAALEKYATNYKNKADIQTFTLDGRDAARLDGPIANRWQILMVIAGGSGSGLITFEGSKAALTNAEPTLLAIAASLHSPPDSDSAAAPTTTPADSFAPTATSAESATEAVAAPVTAELGEGALLAIIDGQVGGSTGMGNELYELNIDTNTGKSLKQFGTTSSSQFNNVTWSPDGSQLAFYDFKSGGLAIVDVNGGNPTLLQGSSFVFAWAPDGKHITNTTPNGDDWMTYDIGLDGQRGSQPGLTLKAMKYVDFLRWSPDGKWLAYIGTPGDNNDNQDALHIIDAAGSNDQVIVPASRGDLGHNVMWSPDSTLLAYIKSDNLTTFEIDSGTTKEIAKQVLAAEWSPDGKQFVYYSRNAQLFIANADGTKPKEIAIPADLKGQVVSIAWRPGTSSTSTSSDAATTTTSSTATTGAASTCTVSAASGANLRSGPGTSFARAGSLAAGTSQTVSGQAKGDDSFVWWKLESGSWVRSDVVQTAGDCSTVPTVTS